MITIQKSPYVIYAESTPNPSAMKFISNKLLIPEGASLEYLNKVETKGAPIANALFSFPFIKKIFISSNYITVTKTDNINWEDITNELRTYIKDYLEAGKEILTTAPELDQKNDTRKEIETALADHVTPVTDIEKKIVEILDTYIKPAVEQDGGLITFKSFNEGLVTVLLKGSCSGCPSSTLTLKAGIEALLKKMIPEVNEVVAEAS